jgi:hypothetical protein
LDFETWSRDDIAGYRPPASPSRLLLLNCATVARKKGFWVNAPVAWFHFAEYLFLLRARRNLARRLRELYLIAAVVIP